MNQPAEKTAPIPYIDMTKAMRREFDKGIGGIFDDTMREGLIRYFEQGIAPGGFMTGALKNELTAILLADPETTPRIPDLVTFLVNYMPSSAWGSPEKVEAWMRQGGLKGRHHE